VRQWFGVHFVSALTYAAIIAVGTVVHVFGQTAGPTVKPYVVIGCITRGPSTRAGDKNAALIITDYRGGPSPIVQLDPSDSKVTPWMNYTVELTGRIAPGSGGTGPAATPRMNVDKVSVISRGCKLQAPSKSAG
jgi:hypothetical protein